MKINTLLAFLCGALAVLALGAQQQHLPRTAGVQLIEDVNALDPRAYFEIRNGSPLAVTAGKAFVLHRLGKYGNSQDAGLFVDDELVLTAYNRLESPPPLVFGAGHVIEPRDSAGVEDADTRIWGWVIDAN